MDLYISVVQGKGDETREYVYLRVTRDCDVGEYILTDTTLTRGNDGVSNKLRHVFWFPDKLVRTGDAVVVRTGTGTDTTATLDSGGTLHRFFWGLREPVWNDVGDAAVLIKVAEWAFEKA